MIYLGVEYGQRRRHSAFCVATSDFRKVDERGKSTMAATAAVQATVNQPDSPWGGTALFSVGALSAANSRRMQRVAVA